MQPLRFSNPNALKIAIKQEISRIKDGKYVRRLDAMLLIAEGRSAYEVAELFGYSPRSLHNWIKAIEENQDFTVLKDKPHPGRPGSLNESHKNELRECLSRPPVESGYQNARWSGKLLSSHIKEQYGISLGVRRCQKLLHELGFSNR